MNDDGFDYGEIHEYMVFDDKSDTNTKRQIKIPEGMSENETTSISLDNSHKVIVQVKEPKRTKPKESVYVRLAKNRKKHQ